ncbi:MAG: MATE family efflux transporter [Clostridia bacterium]|nr:MATE family efflux transporter [Clostridia bacterium]
MHISLSEHFNYRKLLRFTFPSIIMMIFTSVYGVVDGLFVSNFVGKTPFAAINLIWPFLQILGCGGFMLGTGGSALVSKTMGEGDKDKANRYFSLLVITTVVLGIAITIPGMFLIEPVAVLLGADEAMLPYCVTYGRILLAAQTAFMLQGVFQSFLVTAERPTLGLLVTVGAGVTNMVLDFLFIAVLRWGLVGAALATILSQTVGGVVPLIYFLLPNKSPLRLTLPRMRMPACLAVIGKVSINGSSELMTNISMSVVSMLYNYQLMRLAGEDGIAAYGVMMYVSFVFIAVFIGFAVGSAPIVGFHYGAGNHGELKSLLRKSLNLTVLAGIGMAVLSAALSTPLSGIFVGYDEGLYELTRHGFLLYSASFLFAGFGIFGSSFFTALGNGGISAAISFLRTLVFQVAAVLILPLLFDIDGIWFSVTAAELLATGVTFLFLFVMRKKYRYT